MSSLDNVFSWDIFSEREVPEEVQMLSPVSEIVAILQLCQSNSDQAQKSFENTLNDNLAVLSKQAIFVAQFALSLEKHRPKFEQASLNKVYRSLRIIKDQMLSALQEFGLEIIIPQGMRFDEVADSVRVIGWKHEETFTEETVVEVLEPIIRYNNRLLHQGLVVMGAPLAQAVTGSTLTNEFDTAQQFERNK